MAEVKTGTSLAVVFHRVGPYHFARTRAVGKLLPTTLIEIFKSDGVYDWKPVAGAEGFRRISLFDDSSIANSALVRQLRGALDAARPDVVAVPGWADPVAFTAINWCIDSETPAIVMSESTEWDERRSRWKEWIKRRVLSAGTAGLVGGVPQANYLASLGMPPARIFQGYDAVDIVHFASAAADCRLREAECRSKLGLPENFFLASARFVEKKNLLGLLDAYARYRKLAAQSATGSRQSAIWDLVLLGDGPLRSSILQRRSSLGLEGCVHLPGFKQYEELPSFYALAKVFVHASIVEQWGLVVNEAMASGLPVLVSNRCGCAQDLVCEGVNGFTFDPHDAETLANFMLKMSAVDFPLSEFGAEGRRIIANWGPDRFAEGLSRAVSVAVKAGPQPASLAARIVLKALVAHRSKYIRDVTSPAKHKHAPGSMNLAPAGKAELPAAAAGSPPPGVAAAMPNQNPVQNFFSTNAADYSRLFLHSRTGSNFSFRERLALAVEMTANASGRLLDCACGSGEITAAILGSSRLSGATIIDLSPEMLSIAKQRLEDHLPPGAVQCQFVQSDIFAFDERAHVGSYDLILCLGLIAHTGRLEELLGKLKSMLARGGSVLLQSSLLDHLGNRMVRFFSHQRYYRKHGYHISYFRHQDIQLAAEKAGLAIVSCRRFKFGLPFGDRVWGRLNYHLERSLTKWSHRHGAEALYVLQKP